MRRIGCAHHMRRTSACLAVLGLAAFVLPVTASAAPTITLTAKAVPIPGFPHTGNILGAGAALQAEYTISGHRIRRFPAAADRGQVLRAGEREAASAGFRHVCAGRD